MFIRVPQKSLEGHDSLSLILTACRLRKAAAQQGCTAPPGGPPPLPHIPKPPMDQIYNIFKLWKHKALLHTLFVGAMAT